jgi:hypothetical protein
MLLVMKDITPSSPAKRALATLDNPPPADASPTKRDVAEHMRQKVLRSLAIAATRAGATKVELLDSDNEMVRDRASSFVLGLAGIQPATSPSLNINVEVRAGYVIDLSDDPPQAGSTVDHEPAPIR